jgi:hypothetical protein
VFPIVPFIGGLDHRQQRSRPQTPRHLLSGWGEGAQMWSVDGRAPDGIDGLSGITTVRTRRYAGDSLSGRKAEGIGELLRSGDLVGLWMSLAVPAGVALAGPARAVAAAIPAGVAMSGWPRGRRYRQRGNDLIEVTPDFDDDRFIRAR